MLLGCLSLAPDTIPGEDTGSPKPGEEHPFIAMNLKALASGLFPASQFVAHCLEGAGVEAGKPRPFPPPAEKPQTIVLTL